MTDATVLTVNVAEQVTAASQLLVTVNTTVFDPPQADGDPLLLFVKLELHPPLAVTVANQFAYLVSIAACV